MAQDMALDDLDVEERSSIWENGSPKKVEDRKRLFFSKVQKAKTQIRKMTEE